MCVCVLCVSYFSEGANDGALNDASEEDEVDVLGPWSRRHLFKVVQHLLHGCKRDRRQLGAKISGLL